MAGAKHGIAIEDLPEGVDPEPSGVSKVARDIREGKEVLVVHTIGVLDHAHRPALEAAKKTGRPVPPGYVLIVLLTIGSDGTVDGMPFYVPNEYWAMMEVEPRLGGTVVVLARRALSKPIGDDPIVFGYIVERLVVLEDGEVPQFDDVVKIVGERKGRRERRRSIRKQVDYQKRLEEVLDEHPEGLTDDELVELAMSSARGGNRTIGKYVAAIPALLEAGRAVRRDLERPGQPGPVRGLVPVSAVSAVSGEEPGVESAAAVSGEEPGVESAAAVSGEEPGVESAA